MTANLDPLETKPKVDYIFDALERAEVTITHFSVLSRTSRTSLHAWKRGGHVNDALRLDLATNIARRIMQAVEQNRLPLKNREALSPAERLAATKRILKEVGGGG